VPALAALCLRPTGRVEHTGATAGASSTEGAAGVTGACSTAAGNSSGSSFTMCCSRALHVIVSCIDCRRITPVGSSQCLPRGTGQYLTANLLQVAAVVYVSTVVPASCSSRHSSISASRSQHRSLLWCACCLLQLCGLPAQASVNAHLGSTGLGASQDIMGPPTGLRPLAVKAAKNHRFYDVSPKAYNPAQVCAAAVYIRGWIAAASSEL
jgi:hypothetical protein